jgi:hypothetical protein
VSTCRTCGRRVRKTTIALVLRDGSLRGACVCSECETKHGVTIVVKPEITHCKCGKPAVECGGCAHKSEKRGRASVVEDVIKRVRGQLAAFKATSNGEPYAEGRIEAYEAVLSLLEGGRA